MDLGGAASVDLSLVVRVGSALGIGALIGIERERSESAGAFAGSRTLPLLALLGALTQAFFPAILPVVAAVVGLLVAVAYATKVLIRGDTGLTTTVATLLSFVYGAMTTHSAAAFTLAVVLGVVTATLLAAKGSVHAFANALDRDELFATLKFLIVSLVVLPLLPDRELSVLLGLNPRFVWLMVVFVSGISLAAYLLAQYLGPGRSIALVGVLGGLVSSTATTTSMAQRSAADSDLWLIAGFAVVAASTTMFPRALFGIAVVNPSLAPAVALPLGAMTLVGAVIAAALLWQFFAGESLALDLENPFRLRPALLFGALFAVILVLSGQVGTRFGPAGVYATAFVSGLADVDAITLSLSSLAGEGTVAQSTAATGIVVAAIANTLVKAAIAWAFGSPRLGKLAVASLGAISAVGLAIALLV
ncbi:MAG: MgtC/SapB family protein [Haloarculaceae archaeon]